MLTTLFTNALWYLACLPESRRFQRARRDVAEAQRRLLLDIVRRNAATSFGQQHAFATIRSIADYQTRVPLSTYADYEQAIAQIGAGQMDMLTSEPVVLLEPTSGSTAPTKHIPYTKTLQAEFQRGIAPWIVDLYRHEPRLMRGQAYWSISPVAQRNQRTSGGIPIGFEDDSAYLGGVQRHLSRAVMAVPSLVRLIDDVEVWRYVTLLFLLRSRSLALISVWNPTFLTLLVERLHAWWPKLVADIANGTLTPPGQLAPDLHASLCHLMPPDQRRAAEIQRAWAAGGDRGVIHTRLWPGLRLVSCWTDAHAARYATVLASFFPQATLQGKGLIATEGFVSLPLTGSNGAALAVRSHFFEFVPAGTDQAVRLAHELEHGQTYAVVLTTSGGLYRYQLHDLVEVVGHLGNCPLLRFVGKANLVSDWFGEKLDEGHVQHALATLLTRYAVQPAFVMLACDADSEHPAYTLFIEERHHSDETLARLGHALDAALRENYHYGYCRDLGQLAPLRVFRIASNGLETYMQVCQERGQRAGDIKPMVLHRWGGWARRFQGRIVDFGF